MPLVSSRAEASQTAVITGASSGIGRSYARELAARGYDLLITGRRAEKLTALREELEAGRRISVTTRVVELSDRHALSELVGEVAALEQPAVLVNNAGFGRSTPFAADDIDEQLAMEIVHVEAVLRLTHAVLPRMTEHGAGWIINVASLAAYLPLPRGAVYGCSKLSTIAFTESLALELANTGIRFQALAPGFTHTDFHRGPQYEGFDTRNRGLVRWMQPEDVVRTSISAIERGRRLVCVPGLANRIVYGIAKCLPRRLLRAMMAAARPAAGTPAAADTPAAGDSAARGSDSQEDA